MGVLLFFEIQNQQIDNNNVGLVSVTYTPLIAITYGKV